METRKEYIIKVCETLENLERNRKYPLPDYIKTYVITRFGMLMAPKLPDAPDHKARMTSALENIALAEEKEYNQDASKWQKKATASLSMESFYARSNYFMESEEVLDALEDLICEGRIKSFNYKK